MRPLQTLGQDGAMVRPVPEARMPGATTPTTKEIPYDYVATFALQGKRGNRVQDVLNISIEGAFVAVAIGYSFIPALSSPLAPIPVTIDRRASTTTLIEIIAESLAETLTFPTVDNPNLVSSQLATLIQPFVEPRMLMQCLMVRLCGIDFKYAIIDSGSGRELQNLPIHNLAGLGESSGDRPFRPLAKPMVFLPRSTIRIEIEEISEGSIYAGAQLFVVLHGYKMLGYGTGLP